MAQGLEDAGGAIDAALIAREVERARSGSPAAGHDVHEPCANCGTVRQGPYCHACGQTGHVHRTAGALVHDIAHGVFHFEGKIWRTLPLLAWRPGELTRRYLRGERAKFVSPMALFLFSVFLLFAVVANLPGATTHGADQAESARAEARIAALEKVRSGATGEERSRIDEQIGDLQTLAAPASVRRGKTEALKVDSGWRWLDRAVAHASANPELTLYKLKSYGYKYSWALIPISLPFLWLLFALRRDVGIYDHAIFAIYSLSFMSLGFVALSVIGALGVPSTLAGLAGAIGAPLHMYRQLKGTYALGRFGALWRTIALLAICLVAMLLFLAFVFWMGSE